MTNSTSRRRPRPNSSYINDNHYGSTSVPMLHTTSSSYGTIPFKTETTGLLISNRRRDSMESVKKYTRLSTFALCVGVAIFGTTRFTRDNSIKTSLENAYGMSRVQESSTVKEREDHHRLLNKLREEFHLWVKEHGRDYSEEEKDKRFHIWTQNHLRTQEKNSRHGPCKMTGEAVFGSNHFKDLSPEEFQAKYLTGYTGPHTDNLSQNSKRLRSDQARKKNIFASSKKALSNEAISSDGLHDPTELHEKIHRHESVHTRYVEHAQESRVLSQTYYNNYQYQNYKSCQCSRHLKTYVDHGELKKSCGYKKTYYHKDQNHGSGCNKYKLETPSDLVTSNTYVQKSNECEWYDASCWLQRLFAPIYGSGVEHYYKMNYNYPSSLDWRKVGAVTSVHNQGSCGACWAITAVETIESAHYIATGNLVDLAESEVIICEDSCEMCNGGWPQNAYEYAMEKGGLPMESEKSYDGDLLMTMTLVSEGESDELTESEMENIHNSVCPSDSTSSTKRYGKVTGYAYATDRCVCYTDGAGCDCDEQNEILAVMNVASYGPATVCLDASTWQDYVGGIITSASGCSSSFLDMNHCVQAVGYAFTEVDGEDESQEYNTKAEKKLEGYWIIRNQWSSSWGMNGYAYVAMGNNTCGVLNDMTQVFMN